MAYCRKTTINSVYMYPSISGGIVCCGCTLSKEFNENFLLRSNAIKHLLKHRESGNDVPDYAIERLKKEIEELGDNCA